MHVVEAMVRGRHGHDARGGSGSFEPIAALEVAHDLEDVCARRRFGLLPIFTIGKPM
jgi:hypothetical protein